MGRDDRDRGRRESREREYRKRKRYDRDDDDDDDDDDHKYYKRKHKPGAVERILTPGTATNNFIKMGATGIIAGASVLLMMIYAFASDSFGGGYLPIATLVSSAIATASVWIFGRPKNEEINEAKMRELKNQIADLNLTVEEMQAHFETIDKRLTNAEYIENFEERLARKEITSRKLSSDIPISHAPISTPASSNMPGSGATESN